MILKAAIIALISTVTVGLLVLAQQAPTGATVRGRVVYENTGLPVRRAWVGLRLIKDYRPDTDSSSSNLAVNVASNTNSTSGYESEMVTLTNENGEYVLKDVPPGLYFPYVKQPGIFNPTVEDASNPRFQQISVTGTDEIAADIAAIKGGSIEGRVSYQDGSPVIGVKIQIQHRPDTDSENNAVSQTDDRGVYRFIGLRAGDYLVSVSEPAVHINRETSRSVDSADSDNGSSILNVFYPNVFAENEAEKISIELGTERSNIDIAIPNYPFVVLKGQVLSKDENKPLKDVAVSFSKQRGEGRFPSQDHQKARTDEDGRFSFEELLPGKYDIHVGASRNVFFGAGTTVNKIEYASTIETIELTEESNEEVTVLLSRAASIFGKVVFDKKDSEAEQLTYSLIQAFEIETNQYSMSFVSPAGSHSDSSEKAEPYSFKIGNLKPGNYLFNYFSGEGPYIRKVELDGRDITDTGLAVTEGQQINGLNVYLASDFGIVKGRLRSLNQGQTKAVFLLKTDAAVTNFLNVIESSDSVSGKGMFEMKVRPGRYYLTSLRPPKIEFDSSTQKRKTLFEEWVKDAEIIEVEAGQTLEKDIFLD